MITNLHYGAAISSFTVAVVNKSSEVAGMGPHLTQRRLGRGLPSHQVASWSIQLFGHNTPKLQTGQTGEWSHRIGRDRYLQRSPKNVDKRRPTSAYAQTGNRNMAETT